MKIVRITLLALFSISLCLITYSRQPDSARSLAAAFPSPDSLHFRELRARGNKLYEAGKYREAAKIYERGYRESISEDRTASAIRFLNNLAGCRFALFEYRRSLEHYLEAQKLAAKIGDKAMFGTVALNVASMRVAMGETELAARGLEQGVAALQEAPAHTAHLLIQLGWIYSQRGEFDRGVAYFRRGMDEAERRGDDRGVASGLDHLGYEYLRRGQLAEAETYLLAAYRRRLLTGSSELGVSYPKLGMLRHAQGDLDSAARLIDLGLEAAARSSGPWPAAGLYYHRALIRRDQGLIDSALTDFRTALSWARRWRAGVLPSDSSRTAAGAGLHQLRLDFIDTAGSTGSGRRVAEEMFEAAEEQRAASMRESIELRAKAADFPLPPEYAEKLGELRAAEVAGIKSETAVTRAEIARVRNELSELETRARLPLRAPGRLPIRLDEVRRRLRSTEALFSFHTGTKESYVWAVTAGNWAMYRLSSKARLQKLSGDFGQAVNRDRDGGRELGSNLYRELFGSVEGFAIQKPEWLVVLDAPLFEAPLAALVVDGSYLAEKTSLRILPGAWALLNPEPPGFAGQSTFVGVGDSVYNAADTRWQGRPPSTVALENARLAGSSEEVEACARAYGASQPVLLKGWDATRDTLASAVAARPDVLHIASHVVRTSSPGPTTLIHLGLRRSGEAELLDPADIVQLQGAPRVVVLSGCASGSGEALPGEGLMGLTRAWLISGARAVTAAHWGTTDDTGAIFQSFYQLLQEHRHASAAAAAATALQKAQIEMLRSGSWRANPRYWAAFFVVGGN